MANEPVTTIVGNVAGDPELRYLNSGVAVCSFTVAQTPRVKKGDAWEDGETMWVRCTVWRQTAENVAESIEKGTRVHATGRLKVRSWEKDGQARMGLEMDVEHIGPELRYATAKVSKVQRSAGDTSGGTADAWSSTAANDDSAPF
jgi:single-strand DNA-binding protein